MKALDTQSSQQRQRTASAIGSSVIDDVTGSDTRLEQLLRQIMTETNPAKHDEFGAAIWRVLRERERLLEKTRFAELDEH